MKYIKAGAVALATYFSAVGVATADTSVCLITKDATNPFFVKMAQGAFAKAAELGVELRSYAGKFDGDHETQVAAIETCVAAGCTWNSSRRFRYQGNHLFRENGS